TLCSYTAYLHTATPTTDHHPLSLHDALPICAACHRSRCTRAWLRSSPGPKRPQRVPTRARATCMARAAGSPIPASTALSRANARSEEHTSELQSRENLVCRHLLETKNSTITY